MARNRKYQSAAIRFGPALKAFLLCLLIGGSGVGYVWQKTQIYQLDQQIRLREKSLAQVLVQNEKQRQKLDALRSPAWLEEHGKALGLMPPQPSQVWSLPQPSARSGPGTRTYAARADTAAPMP
jgi:hypothetical protein